MTSQETPPSMRSWPTEAESGWQMKMLARDLINRGEIKTEEEALDRFKARVGFLSSLNGQISDETQAVWLRMEQQFMRSALKYFGELREAKESCK